MLANLLNQLKGTLSEMRWQPPAGVRNPDKSRNTRLFNRFIERLGRKKADERNEWLEEGRRIAEKNNGVLTRQIVRRILFHQEVFNITQQYGGEIRRRRRAMARTIATRTWKTHRQTTVPNGTTIESINTTGANMIIQGVTE